MTTKQLLAHATLASLLYLPLSANAQNCDTCAQLSTLNSYVQDISTSLNALTQALFSTLPSFGNTRAAFSAIPAIQNNSYLAQQELLRTVETAYKGSSSNDATLTNNYQTIFDNYLLKEENSATSFDANNASIASLYVNPSVAGGSYSDEQKLAAQRYIMLVSGAAMSTVKAPSSTSFTSTDNPDKDKKTIRTTVSAYYTYSAIQSAIADNFAYIYGLNTGQTIDGTLDNYSGSTISESGLFTYIQSQKTENPDWYTELGSMSVGGLLKEQTVLIGGCFLMLSRIEEDIRRLLITNSVQTTLALMPAQAGAQAIANMPDIKSLLSPS